MKKDLLRRRLRTFVWIAAGGLLLAGCATQERPYSGGGRALSPEEQRLQDVENKVAQLNRRIDAMQSSSNGGSIRSEIRDLRGQIQVLQHQQQVDEKSNADAIRMLSQQIQALSGVPASGTNGAAGGTGGLSPSNAVPGAGASGNAYGSLPAAGTASGASGGAAAGNANVTAGSAEQTLYLANFADLKGGHFNQAISGFRSQIAKYPQGNYADNAWYWLGESYYVQQHYAKAMQAFKTLVSQFPASPKVPDALLETGRVYKATGKTSAARSTWQHLQRDYPQSDAAQSAQKLLAELH